MSPAETLYHQIAAELPDAAESKMFGAKCLKAPNGKALALYWKECMVFKLTGDAAADALSLNGAQMFTPMEGRPMNGWVQVPFDYAEHWKGLAEEALAYVRELEKRKSLAAELKKEVKLAAKSSQEILKEMEQLEDESHNT